VGKGIMTLGSEFEMAVWIKQFRHQTICSTSTATSILSNLRNAQLTTQHQEFTITSETDSFVP